MASSGYSKDVVNAIVKVRTSKRPNDLGHYARRWLERDNSAVLAAIVENEFTPYSAIAMIVEGKWNDLEILKIAYKHNNADPMLRDKIKKKLDENAEPTSYAFLP